jgi:hypothetical protein
MPFQDTPKVWLTGFPETSVNAYQNTRRHILEDSTLDTVPPDYMENLQHDKRLELENSWISA